jgi:hypothetical protein
MMTVIAANYKSVHARRATISGVRRRTVWRALGLGALAGTAYAVWRAIDANRTTEVGWEPQPFPFPPQPRAADASTGATAPWVEPDDGVCPSSHPVKAKLASGIYHRPGGQSYDRTRPDRCYRDGSAAEADGLRAAKR